MQHVVDVTDADFEQIVVEGSRERPVVVDLWASWCGPCRTLGPILEKVAEERGGAFLLAKLDIDANQVGQALLQAVQSQGIPTTTDEDQSEGNPTAHYQHVDQQREAKA